MSENVKEIIDNDKVKKVFLDHLPRYRGSMIHWRKCIGQKVKFIYSDIEGEIEIIDYDGKFLHIKYLDKPLFKIFTGDFTNCQLGKLLGIRTIEFKVEIGQNLKDDRRDITIIDRKYMGNPYNKGKQLKWYKYKCNKCSFNCGEHYKNGEFKEEYWIEECNLLKGTGCSCCANKVAVTNINSIWETDRWICDLGVSEEDAKKYISGSNDKIIVTCPDCSRIKDKKIRIYDIRKYKGISCSCNDGYSYPNKFAFSFLEQLGVEFISEYSPSWIKPKRYDFYFELNDRKYILEMDGVLGHGKKMHSKSKITKEESVLIDDYKDLKAKEHRIEVIRINSDESKLEFIKGEILDSELKGLFDLSKINWNKCEEFALSNRVKEACEIFRNKTEDMKEISKIMGIDKRTVWVYIKQGVELGWCNYNGKESMRKSNSKNGKTGNKPIEIFKEGTSLGIFPSGAELSRQSLVKFGVKLIVSSISSVCLGKLKHHKGFMFKFVTEDNERLA